MPAKISFVLLLSILLLTLSGCNDTVFPARRISSDAADVSEVAIAIDAGGGKHVAAIECPQDRPSPCELVYRYAKGYEDNPAVRITISPSFTIRYPDIAADNAGGFYLVWQMCELGYTNCEDYFGIGNKTGFQVADRLAFPYDSAGPPKLASRGSYVYVVYEVPDGAGSALRYRQLSPLDASGGWVSTHPGNAIFRRDASLAIRETGTLFVAWREIQLTQDRIFNNDNYGTTGAMVHEDSWIPGDLSAPEIEISADGATEIITWADYGTTINPSDSIIAATCPIATGTCNPAGAGQGTFDMPAVKNWVVQGGPAIAAGGSNAYIAFSANNTDTGAGYEIFSFRWQPATTMGAPSQRTFNGLLNERPFVEMVNNYEVIVWRVDIFPPAHGDIFWSRFPFTEINTIRQAQNGNGRDGADVASNGTQMAGVWLEMHDSMYGELDQAWMTFNGYGTYLPLIVH